MCLIWVCAWKVFISLLSSFLKWFFRTNPFVSLLVITPKAKTSMASWCITRTGSSKPTNASAASLGWVSVLWACLCDDTTNQSVNIQSICPVPALETQKKKANFDIKSILLIVLYLVHISTSIYQCYQPTFFWIFVLYRPTEKVLGSLGS